MSIYSSDKSIYGDVNSISELENKFSSHTLGGNSYEIVISNSNISAESMIFINTYNELFRRNFKSRILMPTALSPIDELDFSPLINELAKFFELELNLSIVQWMRAKEGIEMPKYYNKYKVCDKEYLWQGKVNFNQRNSDGTLRGIPIGNAYCYAADSLRCSSFPNQITNPKELLSIWNKIREVRNEAAHSEVSLFADFNKMASNINALIANRHLDDMITLKKDIKR